MPAAEIFQLQNAAAQHRGRQRIARIDAGSRQGHQNVVEQHQADAELGGESRHVDFVGSVGDEVARRLGRRGWGLRGSGLG